MFCKKCGNKIKENQKFCVNCGEPFSHVNKKEIETSTEQHEASWGIKKLSTWIVIFIITGLSIYGGLDDNSITTNNDALTSFNQGDSQNAIDNFQKASDEAFTDETKVITLMNLGYVYSSESQYDEALQSFEEAFLYTEKDSFDYFLISGEIALLEFKPNSALISYNKAYELNPNSFQINNALGLFYLDMESIAPNYLDYRKALQYLQKAYEVSDYDTKNIAKENLGIAHFFNDNFNQSISLLSSLYTDSRPYIAYWLGLAYAGKEDTTNAKLYLQKAIDLGVEVEQEVYDYIYSY